MTTVKKPLGFAVLVNGRPCAHLTYEQLKAALDKFDMLQKAYEESY